MGVAAAQNANASDLSEAQSSVFSAPPAPRPRPLPLVAARIADHTMLDEVIAELTEIERSSGLTRTLAIGELVLTRFFGDDPKVWRDRRRNKNNSIRRLAERPDCPLGRSALNEAVAVFVAVRALPCAPSFSHVSVSHIAAVLRLPPPQRQEMLARCECERWSVRRLREAAVSARRAQGERRGRPPNRDAERLLAVLETGVRRLEAVANELCKAEFTPDTERRLSRIATELSALHHALQHAGLRPADRPPDW